MSFLESFGVTFLDTLGQGIDERKTKGLQPKPIDAADLLEEIIYQMIR